MEPRDILLFPPPVRESVSVEDVPIYRRKRYFLVIMIMLGLCLMNLLRCTLPTAIVDMTTSKNTTVGDQVFVQDAEFKWTAFDNGMLLGIRQCLGMASIIGGVLTYRFGSTKTLGASLLLNGVFTLIFPLTVHWSKPIFFFGRILDGAAYSSAVGSWTQVFVKWAPSDERSRMADSALSGFFFGGIIGFPVCGVIIEKWGWPWVFYISGGLMILWWIVWVIFIFDDPSKDKFILTQEKYYILQNTKPTLDQNYYPWKEIFTSKACWALMNERFVEAWTLSFALECLPLYVKGRNCRVLSIEIAGEYAGMLHGIAGASLVVGYVFNPILISVMVQNHTPAEWRHYFLLLSALNLWAAIIFFFFGSGKPEKWTSVEKKTIQYELVEMKSNDEMK